LHDIGKVGVPDSVLNKDGRPSEDEWQMIKRHPVIGHGVLAPVRFLRDEHKALVRHHHEKIDGSGYPDGLQGDELSIMVRIIAAADSYDAMASTRAYRKALPNEIILAEFEKNAGTQFDMDVAKLFIEMIQTGEINQAGYEILTGRNLAFDAALAELRRQEQ